MLSYVSLGANTGCLTNTGLMLGHRLRRWPSIKSAFVQRPLSADVYIMSSLLIIAAVHIYAYTDIESIIVQ